MELMNPYTFHSNFTYITFDDGGSGDGCGCGQRNKTILTFQEFHKSPI